MGFEDILLNGDRNAEHSNGDVVYVTYGILQDQPMSVDSFVELLDSLGGKVAPERRENGRLVRVSEEEYEHPIPGAHYVLLDIRVDG